MHPEISCACAGIPENEKYVCRPLNNLRRLTSCKRMRVKKMIGRNLQLCFVIFCVSFQVAQSCHPSCADCFGDGANQCISCADYHYIQPSETPNTQDVATSPELEGPVNTPYNTTNTTTTTTTTPTTTTALPTTVPGNVTTSTAPQTTTTPVEVSDFLCVLQCDPGWYGDPDGNATCRHCAVTHCAMCASNGSVCLVCENDWDLQGNSCAEFSSFEIALIVLTAIFGGIVLLVVIMGLVLAARNGTFDSCLGACSTSACTSVCACCGSCDCCKTEKKPSRPTSTSLVAPPNKEELLKSETGAGTLPRYAPAEGPSQSQPPHLIKQNPTYPESYTTSMEATRPIPPPRPNPTQDDDDYDPVGEENHNSEDGEWYDDVDSPEQVQERKLKPPVKQKTPMGQSNKYLEIVASSPVVKNIQKKKAPRQPPGQQPQRPKKAPAEEPKKLKPKLERPGEAGDNQYYNAPPRQNNTGDVVYGDTEGQPADAIYENVPPTGPTYGNIQGPVKPRKKLREDSKF